MTPGDITAPSGEFGLSTGSRETLSPEARKAALAAARRWRKIENLARGGLLGAVLVMVPLCVQSAGQDQFLLPKRLAITVLMGLALLVWAAGLAWGRRFRLQWQGVLGAAALFLLAHMTGWLAGLRDGSSLPLATDRLGLVAQAFLLILLLQDFARGRRLYLIAIGWLIVMSGMATAGWVLSEDVGRWLGSERSQQVAGRLEDWRYALSAGLGNPGFVADWIALSFAPATMLLLRVRSIALLALLHAHLTLGAAALVVCWSVHSNAGLILGAAMMIAHWWRHRRKLLQRRRARIVTQLVLWAAIVAFFVVPHPANPHPRGILNEALGSDRWQAGGSTRLVIWAGTASMVMERPIFGWGTGNFTYGYPQALNRIIPLESPMAVYVGQWTNAAHNCLLQAWAEMGLPGIAALLLLAWTWWGSIRRRLGRANPINDDLRTVALGMGVMGAVHAQMNFVLQLPSFLMFYAALVSVPALLVDRNRSLRDHPMEMEQRWPNVSIVVRGEGMRRLRGLSLTLYLSSSGKLCIMAVAAMVAAGPALWMWNRQMADIHYNVGYFIVQKRGGEPAPIALAAFDQALRLNPGLPDALSDRAKFYYRRANWEEVLHDTEAAMKRLQAPKLLFWRAEALARLGLRNDALATMSTVLQRRSPHAFDTPEALADAAARELERALAAPEGTTYGGM